MNLTETQENQFNRHSAIKNIKRRVESIQRQSPNVSQNAFKTIFDLLETLAPQITPSFTVDNTSDEEMIVLKQKLYDELTGEEFNNYLETCIHGLKKFDEFSNELFTTYKGEVYVDKINLEKYANKIMPGCQEVIIYSKNIKLDEAK